MLETARHATTVEAVRRSSAVAEDVQTLLRDTATAVRRAVPHAASSWLATDPVTGLFVHGHIEGFSDEVCTPWFRNELLVEDVHKFRDLTPGRAALGSGIADRARRSPRWTEVMRPNGYDDEVRISCGDAGGAWASVEIQRADGDRDFDRTEVTLLEDVAPLLAAGVRRLAVEAAARREAPDGPGIVRVYPDGTVSPLTASGAQWLALLPGPSGSATSLTTMLGIAQLGAELAAGRISPAQARVRARTVDGRWLTLHAQPVLGDDEAVLVVLEPSSPGEVADVLGRAYGLTDRELEVVLSLARGSSTKDMASQLFLSPHTVRDHVKSAMAKVDVSSRGELVATLFERHYAADFFAGVSHQV